MPFARKREPLFLSHNDSHSAPFSGDLGIVFHFTIPPWA